MTLHAYQLAALVAAARWVVEGARGERAHAAVYPRLTTHSRSSRPSWRKRTRKRARPWSARWSPDGTTSAVTVGWNIGNAS